MKTSVKQLAAGTILAILIMVGNTNAKAAEVKTLTPTAKTTFEIENWMVDESFWNVETSIKFEIIEETETDLELEYWMTSEETWNLTDNIVDETETELMVEDWMFSESIWNKE